MLSEFGMLVDWLYPVLEKRGLSRNHLAQHLHSDVDSLPAFLPIEKYLSLLEWCAQTTKDPHLWLKIGFELNPSDIGLVGYLYQNSATIGDLLHAVERYQVTYMMGMHWEFSHHGALCEGRYSISHEYNVGVRHDIEFSISSALGIFSKEAESNKYLKKICVPYPEDDFAKLYADFLGISVHFDQPYASIVLDSDILSLPIGNSDPRLLQLLQLQIDETLHEIEGKNEFIDQVRLLITTTMGDETYDLNQLCRQLNISSRTLHRRLKKYNFTYLSLKEEVMVNLARGALTKTDASITEIGLNLGFSEVSSFIRSFKRLCGVSPLQYRNKPISV